MPIFISYSHKNRGFVNELAANIVRNRGSVWVDTWELNVGDSLLEKIQTAITKSSALIAVLSKPSVESEWCKRELAAAMIRELEEKRVLLLPVLLEDCEIPLFLRDKVRADFRYNFDRGLKDILDAISSVSNGEQSRLDSGAFTVDWAEDWWFEGDLVRLRFTMAETSKDIPITLLTEVRVSANEAASGRYAKYADAGIDWMGRAVLGGLLFEAGEREEIILLLKDQFTQRYNFTIADNRSSMSLEVSIKARKLGQDTGKDHLVKVSAYLRDISNYQKSVYRKLTPQETERMKQILTEA